MLLGILQVCLVILVVAARIFWGIFTRCQADSGMNLQEFSAVPALQVMHPNTGRTGDVGPGTSHPPGMSGSGISPDPGRPVGAGKRPSPPPPSAAQLRRTYREHRVCLVILIVAARVFVVGPELQFRLANIRRKSRTRGRSRTPCEIHSPCEKSQG